MIKIEKLIKRYHQNIILNDIDLKLPRTGIIGLHGHSGSGKSTFMKVLAGLLEFTGHVGIYSTNIESLEFDQACDYRLRDIGLIFQTYRLFEHETVAWNMALPLYLLGHEGPRVVQKHVQRALKDVGLEGFGTRKVATLSGGEKQRVAFARALIKQPPIVLADEPTSALDGENKKRLMQILSTYAAQHLVIIVSHDLSLLNKYAHISYQMVDGRLTGHKIHHPNTQNLKHTMIRLKRKPKLGSLPLSFCFRHALHDMKSHKWRHFLSQIMLSIAILALGIGIQVTASINSKVQTTINRLIGPSGLELTAAQINNSGLRQVYAADLTQVEDVAKRYPDYVTDIGVAYQTSIDDLFPQRNELFLISEGPIVVLPSFSARHLAEPLGFDEAGVHALSLKTDEIALMLPDTDLKLLARKVGVASNTDEINKVLINKTIYLGAGFANDAWIYEDEQIWRLVKIYAGDRATVLHSNLLFPQFVFETSMRLAATTDLTSTLPLPWMLRKSFYLKTNDGKDLIDILYKDLQFFGMRFDHIGHSQMKTYCPKFGRCPLQRIVVYLDPHQTLSLSHLNYILAAEPRLKEPILTTSGGYLLYPESMFAGFANETLFARNRHDIDQIVDWLSFTNHGQIVSLPQMVARGHYQDQSESSVKLKQTNENKYLGRLPVSLDEIAISTALARHLHLIDDWQGHELHIATRIVIGQNEDGISSEFITTKHAITAIIFEDDPAIYGCSLWSVAYYRDLLGFSGESLRIERAYFAGGETFLEYSCRRIMATFPHLEARLPQKELRHSLTSLTKNIDVGIYALAGVAGINSLLLTSLVLRLAWLDIAKDKTLLLELGARPKQIIRLLTARAIIIVFGSLFGAIVQMIVAALFIEQALATYFHSTYIYSFPSAAIATMTLFSGFIYMILLLVFYRFRQHQVVINS